MSIANKFPQFVGFDDLFNQFDAMFDGSRKAVMPTWPPYNVKKNDDGSYTIELAVAGFSKTDIDVTVEGNKLTVKGESKTSDSNYIYKGIADRSFERTFTLADNVVVKGGEFTNGMLKIALETQAAISKALKLELK